MPIYRTPYDTTACIGANTTNIRKAIQDAFLYKGLNNHLIHSKFAGKNINICVVEGGNVSQDTIPYFSQPLLVNTNGSEIIVVDARSFGKFEVSRGEFVIRNKTEFAWNLQRAALTDIWIHDNPILLKNIADLPAYCFASLVSELIGRRYGLDMGELLIVKTVCSYYYYCLFTDDRDMDELEYNKTVGKIAKYTHIPASKVFDICSELGMISSISELVEKIKEKTQSIRLNDFNDGVLMTLVASNWYGTNAQENIVVGMEHIPTWFMIVYASITESSYKRSTVAKLIQNLSKMTRDDNFDKAMKMIVGDTDEIARTGL